VDPKENEQTKLLKEILIWIKFAGMKDVKAHIESTLKSDQQKIVYQLSDRSKTIAEINGLSGASVGAISGYWKKWVKQGLGETESVMGGDRFKRSFDLEDIGIEVPRPKKQKKSRKSSKKQTGNKQN
jgi:hypothetical protein